jgi:hypothetical protein
VVHAHSLSYSDIPILLSCDLNAEYVILRVLKFNLINKIRAKTSHITFQKGPRMGCEIDQGPSFFSPEFCSTDFIGGYERSATSFHV